MSSTVSGSHPSINVWQLSLPFSNKYFVPLVLSRFVTLHGTHPVPLHHRSAISFRGFVLASPPVPLRGPFPEPFLIGRPCFQTGHRSTCAAEIDERPVGDLAAASSRRRDVRGTCDDRCVSLLRKHVLTCCDPPGASKGAKEARIRDETGVEEERDAEHGRKGRASFFFFFVLLAPTSPLEWCSVGCSNLAERTSKKQRGS